MQVLNAVLAQVLADSIPLFPAEDLKIIAEGRCYLLLQRIRDVVADESLGDPECFQKIEEIIRILNESLIDTGPRHDFG